jgi:hypothetical protein
MANGTFRQGDRLASYTVANGNNTDNIQKVALVDSAGADASATLPTGAATAANQTTGNTTLSAISGKLPASLGAKTTANSLSVATSALTCAAGGDGSVGNSAETITVAATVQLVEFFNLSANPIWLSWTGTASAATGSFPVPPLASNTAGYYSAPPGASGSLSIIAPAGASAFTCNLWS